MASETTRLLQKKPPPAAVDILPVFKELSLGLKILSIPRLAWRWHGYAIGASLISAIINWRLGFAEVNVFDPIIFKSLFVVFGFAVGFRNVNASKHHAFALKQCHQLVAGFWSIVLLFADIDDCRQQVHDAFRRVLLAFADHIISVSDRRAFWYAVASLEPSVPSCEPLPSENSSRKIESVGGDAKDDAAKTSEPHEVQARAAKFMSDAASTAVAFGRSAALAAASAAAAPFADEWAATATPTLISAEAGFSPRLLLVSTLLWCEEKLEVVELSLKTVHLRRAFWLYRQQVLKAYQEIESLAMPSMGHRYIMLIDMCFFMFAMCLPWGMTVHPLISRLYYSQEDAMTASGVTAGVCLCVNTVLCTMVLFGLNGLAREQEDPFRGGGDEDISLHRLARLFDTGLKGYESRLDVLKAGKGKESIVDTLNRANLLDAMFVDVGQASGLDASTGQ
eukprot:TRINITY_DN5346_c0_g2_i1.p1 TRINITY_DN5346_c0_g2~~TRINITY_DN5346_c0_g2_i1.p1  ORF type:complete len:479 (-),score=87.64 TRINITY_DN5346_c0_g2_i1:474-1826(-)